MQKFRHSYISNKSSQILGLSNRANQFTDHDLRGHIGSSEGASLENVRCNKTDCQPNTTEYFHTDKKVCLGTAKILFPQTNLGRCPSFWRTTVLSDSHKRTPRPQQIQVINSRALFFTIYFPPIRLGKTMQNDGN